MLDRVAESYFGEMNEQLQKETQKRIDWICNQVFGKNVLDIGCSQGICELILARKGFEVVGFDIEKESIDYAKNLIGKERVEVRERVTLCLGDFLSLPHLKNCYDTVIMTEILEHLEEPINMIERAAAHLVEGGYMVVTVPFGINDFPDHKQTFYMMELYEMLSRYVGIVDIKFFGDWIGFVGIKGISADKILNIDYNLCKSEEDEFYKIERVLRDNLKEIKIRYKKAVEDYYSMKKKFEDIRDSYQQNSLEKSKQIKELENKTKNLDRLAIELDICNKKLQEKQALEIMLQDDIEKYKNKVSQLERNIIALKDTDQKLNVNYGKVLRERDLYKQQYELLKNSKLGRLTLKYWKIKDWFKARCFHTKTTVSVLQQEKSVKSHIKKLNKEDYIIENDDELPSVSVIIPTYKENQYISQCVKSVLNQNYPMNKLQIIICVNGKNIEYFKSQKKLYEDNSQIDVVYTSTSGAAAGRNYAVKYVRCECITFLDDDDTIQSNYIRSMAKHVKNGVMFVIGNWIDYAQETDKYIEDNYITNTIKITNKGVSESYFEINSLLSSLCGKLYSMKLWNNFLPIDETVKNTEDVVFWADNFQNLKGKYYLCEKEKDSAYVRRITPVSLSRPSGEKYVSFYIYDRIDIIERLSISLMNANSLNVKKFIMGKINAQTDIMFNAYQNLSNEDKEKAVNKILQSDCLFLNKSKFGEKHALAFCHNFSPTADPSAYVATKRLQQISEKEGLLNWHVVSANMKNCRNEDDIFNEFYAKIQYTDKIVIGNKAYFNEKAQYNWGVQACKEAENKFQEDINVMYSRSMWAGSHIAAYLYKLRHPNVKWYAEFSDPIYMEKDDIPRKASSNFNSEELDHFWEYVEKIVYENADVIIFTNLNQKKYMLNSFPDQNIAKTAEKRGLVIQHPIIDQRYCNLFKSSVQFDDNHIHIAYFGAFYTTRRADGMYRLLSNKNVILHLFVSNSGDASEITNLPERVIVHDTLQYFEFLNLANNVDYLAIVDPIFSDPMKNPYLPSKLADYLATKTPILAVINDGSPLSKMSSSQIINITDWGIDEIEKLNKKKDDVTKGDR